MADLKILVIEDNPDKRDRVVAALKHELRLEKLTVEVAIDYESALRALQDSYCDLVVLDLLLPAAGQGPSKLTSRTLIRNILNGTLLPPLHIIGLTEFAEVGEEERQFYEENLFALEVFSWDNTGWAGRIAAKVRYLIRSKAAATTFGARNFGIDVFILAARYENEYAPIKRLLFGNDCVDGHSLWNGRISFGDITLPDDRKLSAALACVGEMGMAPTAAMAAQAVSVFRPRLLAMLGMCCGFAVDECAAPQALMDAIVVRDVVCWEEGKYVEESGSDSEFKNRSKPRVVDDAIRGAIETLVEEAADHLAPQLRRFAGRKAYKDIRGAFGDKAVREVPSVRFGTLVSGSSVIADEKLVKEIISRQPNAIGLDMEVFGLYTAAERCFGRRPSVLAVKGVADFGHAKKNDGAQKLATTVAVEVFRCLLTGLPIFAKSDD